MIEETHRCAHIVPVVIRQSTVDTELLGHQIPKGTHLFFYTSGASFLAPAFDIPDHRRTERGRSAKNRFGVWDPANVREFAPERWLRTEKGEGGGSDGEVFDSCAGPQLAFGAGPRGCFGRRLAYLEMRLAIVLLLWAFEFVEMDERLNNFDGVDFFAVTPKDCYVKLRKIQR
jgi:cytochrome P450